MEKKSLIARILIALVRAYQLTLSPFFSGHCRFYPSCSEYASEALHRHGAWGGTRLAIRRVLRCHPFARGGDDPVPAVRPSRRSPKPGELGKPGEPGGKDR